jgi:hypothetical protein
MPNKPVYKPITMATTIPRINRIFRFVNIAQRVCFIDTKGIKEVVLAEKIFDHPEYSVIETYENADEMYRCWALKNIKALVTSSWFLANFSTSLIIIML